MTSILIYTLAGASAALFVRWLLQVPKVKDNDHSWLDRGSRLSLSTIPGRKARPGHPRPCSCAGSCRCRKSRITITHGLTGALASA